MWYYGRRRWFNTRGERWPLSETTMTTASNARVSRTVGRTKRVCSRSRENARWREKLEKKSNKSPGREDRTVRRKVRTFYHFGREYTYTHTLARAIVTRITDDQEKHAYVRSGVNVPTDGRRILRRCTSSGAPPVRDGWAVAYGKSGARRNGGGGGGGGGQLSRTTATARVRRSTAAHSICWRSKRFADFRTPSRYLCKFYRPPTRRA